MENVISKDDRIAIAEVDYIIHHMNERYLNKIPQKVRDYITILKKKNCEIYVDPKLPLEKQNLKEFTLYFLMILNLKYWCNDERRKEILAMMENNQRKYDDKINNIFNQAETMQSVTSDENMNNKPKQVTVIENKNIETSSSSSTTDVIGDLEKEEKSIVATSKENIFLKIINAIKSKFIKK